MNFEIITDSSANLSDELIRKYGIRIASLTFLVEGVEYRSYDEDKKTDLGKFYEMMRNGQVIKTSLVNTGQFVELMEPILKEGKDILYIGMSSALSGTYQSGVTAAELLAEEYPDRKIITVDSLSASLGQGLLVIYAAQLRDAGRTLAETAEWVMASRLKMRHHFTVDDLMFLKRGGRISATSAMVGTEADASRSRDSSSSCVSMLYRSKSRRSRSPTAIVLRMLDMSRNRSAPSAIRGRS